VKENRAVRVLGSPLEETRLRAGLEQSLRSMAGLVTGEERIQLVDRANEVRPRTLF
jgi:serine/threonine-protein kinase PknG